MRDLLLILLTLPFLGVYGADDQPRSAHTSSTDPIVIERERRNDNRWIRALNDLHYFSSRLWQHQEERPVYASQAQFLMRLPNGRQLRAPTGETTAEAVQREVAHRKTIPNLKAGVFVEGAGELADIATLTATNPKLIAAANALALASRATDVGLGSFPQFWLPEEENPVPRFWGRDWQNETNHEIKTHLTWTYPHIATHWANQAGKAWDILRAGSRIKNAQLIAWYNKNKLSNKKRKKLRIIQGIHTALLMAGLITKHLQQDQRTYFRYPYLIGEATISLLRRLHMRHTQNKMLTDARDEWALTESESLPDACPPKATESRRRKWALREDKS